jgi:hypothetical protein
MAEIADKSCDELWFNPGTVSDEVKWQAERLGMQPILGCSIVDLGIAPSELD